MAWGPFPSPGPWAPEGWAACPASTGPGSGGRCLGEGEITGENSICDYVNGKKNVITVLVSQTDVYRWLVKGLY